MYRLLLILFSSRSGSRVPPIFQQFPSSDGQRSVESRRRFGVSSTGLLAKLFSRCQEHHLSRRRRQRIHRQNEREIRPPEPPYQTVDELVKAKGLTLGDPIEVEDRVLRHWALYAGEAERNDGNGSSEAMVVHLFSVDGKPHEVRYDSLATASCGKRCRVNKKYDSVLDARPPEEVMRAAHGMLGNKNYNILSNNCEHFVTGCRYGFFVSEQVQEASGSWSKQAEIASTVLRNGLNTATYTFTGFSPFK